MVTFALETYGRFGPAALKHLRARARSQAQGLPEGGGEALSWMLQRWSACLSTALHRSNAARLRSALGVAESSKARALDLAAALAR